MPSRRICLVTPSHVASNPRLVKEADALHAAGHRVHVVGLRYFPTLDPQDAAIYGPAPWGRTVVDITRGPGAAWAKLRRRLVRLALARGLRVTPGLAAHAHHAAIPALAAAAARVPADLYIGHCLAGLVAAAEAARRTRATLGFDAEDFHSAETDTAENDPLEHEIITVLERAALPGCTHLTAASPLIAEAYAKTYGIRRPLPVLNVFPLSEAPPRPEPRPSPSEQNPALVYWFSQTIGPGRGLEEIFPLLAALRTPVELHLRGFVSPEYRASLVAAALAAGVRRPLVFHGFAPMSEMIRLAARHDLGLSLEPPTPGNRKVCLANKIFTYLLAGLPQLLSPTDAHRALASDLGAAGWLIDPERPADLAARLDAWWRDPAAVHASRLFAWQLGQTRYNWDHASQALVAAVDQIVT